MTDVKEQDRTLSHMEMADQLVRRIKNGGYKFADDSGEMLTAYLVNAMKNHVSVHVRFVRDISQDLQCRFKASQDDSGVSLNVSWVRPDFGWRHDMHRLAKEYNDLLMVIRARTLGCPPAMADLVDEDTADPVPWHVLADWCEEHGHQPLADRLRKGRVLIVVQS